jgi:hypothetical protein
MVISWLITTLATSVLVILVEYINQPSITVDDTVIYTSPSFLKLFLAVIAINLFFWLPAIKYLHKIKKLSLISSIISSIAAAVIGTACVIGIGILYFYAVVQFQQTNELSGYTDWTIGHIHYWPGIISNILLWGINGIIFWKLYGKFATNQ